MLCFQESKATEKLRSMGSLFCSGMGLTFAKTKGSCMFWLCFFIHEVKVGLEGGL